MLDDPASPPASSPVHPPEADDNTQSSETLQLNAVQSRVDWTGLDKPPDDVNPSRDHARSFAWWRKIRSIPAHVLAAAALAVILLELIAFDLLGPVWWAILNAAAVASVFAWRHLRHRRAAGRNNRGGGFLGMGRRRRTGPSGSGSGQRRGLLSRLQPTRKTDGKGASRTAPGRLGRMFGARAKPGPGGRPVAARRGMPAARTPQQNPKRAGGSAGGGTTGRNANPATGDASSPKPAANDTNEGKTPVAYIKYSDDQSLQRAGRNLASIEEAAAEVARLTAVAEAAQDAFRATLGKVRNQMETDLPTSHRLSADVEALATRVAHADTADAWKSVALDAATLPETYRREHETDEDRVNAPRRSLHAEKRADVTTAVQDN